MGFGGFEVVDARVLSRASRGREMRFLRTFLDSAELSGYVVGMATDRDVIVPDVNLGGECSLTRLRWGGVGGERMVSKDLTSGGCSACSFVQKALKSLGRIARRVGATENNLFTRSL